MCVSSTSALKSLLLVSPHLCLPVTHVLYMSGGEGRTTGHRPTGWGGESNSINKAAVGVTRVTFAVTEARHQRGAWSQRASLKSACNCDAGVEVLSFTPGGALLWGQMRPAFSGTLARIRSIS